MTPLEEAELVGRVARLEEKVAEIAMALGLEEPPDPLRAGTEEFRAANRAKSKAGVKTPGR